jgi:peptidoglycan/LPS O-acetylase OafA/YrhL
MGTDCTGVCLCSEAFEPRREIGGEVALKKLDANYIPTLDGWRAVAILLVIFSHMPRLPLPGHWGASLSLYLWISGVHGVSLFFAISGILICTRLLQEEEINGAISLKSFYIRRFFRILPPAAFYLVVIGCIALLGYIVVQPMDWLASLFFFRCYMSRRTVPALDWWYTSHFWSLSVEEHFYMIFPSILAFTKRWRLPVLGAMIAVLAVWNIWVAYFMHLSDETIWIRLGEHTDGAIDALFLAALAAIWIRSGQHREQFIATLAGRWNLLIFAVLAVYYIRHSPILLPDRVIAVLLILCTVLKPSTVVGKLLENPVLRWVGRLSYSIYLWQMLFCYRFEGDPPLGILARFPVNVVAILALSMLSYYFVEKPMIRIGRRLAKAVIARSADKSEAVAHSGA